MPPGRHTQFSDVEVSTPGPCYQGGREFPFNLVRLGSCGHFGYKELSRSKYVAPPVRDSKLLIRKKVKRAKKRPTAIKDNRPRTQETITCNYNNQSRRLLHPYSREQSAYPENDTSFRPDRQRPPALENPSPAQPEPGRSGTSGAS